MDSYYNMVNDFAEGIAAFFARQERRQIAQPKITINIYMNEAATNRKIGYQWTVYFCNCENHSLAATIIFDRVSIPPPSYFLKVLTVVGRNIISLWASPVLIKRTRCSPLRVQQLWMCIKSKFFRFCSHMRAMGEIGAAGWIEINDPDVIDGGPAGDAS